jgi:flagellar hook-associated protein 3 FlgL
MRIATNTITGSALNQIMNLTNSLSTIQHQVSTGQRVSQPEDDPTAVGQLINLQSEQQQLAQYQKNASTALNISQASTAALTSLKSISDNASEIATSGSSTENAAEATAYATQVNQLLEEAVQSANATLNGSYLFDGSSLQTAPFQVARDANGDITSVTAPNSSPTPAPIQLSDTASVSPYTSAATNQGLADFLNNLVSLRDALTANNSSTVATVSSSLQTSESTIIDSISQQGAIQSGIQVIQSQQQTNATNLDSLVSQNRDADMAKVMTQLSQAQVAYQASLQSTALIMSKSLIDYL